jgi:hypothetical protein
MFGLENFSYPSRISNKTATKERGEKISCHILFLLPKISQNCKLFYFGNAEYEIWANFQRSIELFTLIFVNKLSKIWVWDLGSEIRKKPIPVPRSGSRIWNTVHQPPELFSTAGSETFSTIRIWEISGRIRIALDPYR